MRGGRTRKGKGEFELRTQTSQEKRVKKRSVDAGKCRIDKDHAVISGGLTKLSRKKRTR